MRMQMQDVLECTVQSYGSEGEGVCKPDGFTVFVPGAIKDERVRIRITETNARFARADLIDILSPSPHRQTPFCLYYGRCGGCSLQHMSYEATLEYKRAQVAGCLKHIGGLDVPVAPTLACPKRGLHYRNKAEYAVDARGAVGFFAARSRRVVDVEACALQHPAAQKLANALRVSLKGEGAANLGNVRGLVVRMNHADEALAIIVTRTNGLAQKEALIRALCLAVPTLRGIVHNIQPKQTTEALGPVCHTLWGRDALEDCLSGVPMRISPLSFFQINRAQAERLFAHGIKGVLECGIPIAHALDAYCGGGAIALQLAGSIPKVTGVEIVRPAVLDARENARRAGLDGVIFLHGAAEDVLARWPEPKPELVCLDPPRAGCDARLIDALMQNAPRLILYVSCNPATLARDIKLLCQHGHYAMLDVQPADFFGWTGHVECGVLLSRL